jgi:hypothetical protein
MVPPTNPIQQRLKGYSLIANGNVVGIFQYKDSLFYLDGLAHMGLVIGKLYSLVPDCRYSPPGSPGSPRYRKPSSSFHADQ